MSVVNNNVVISSAIVFQVEYEGVESLTWSVIVNDLEVGRGSGSLVVMIGVSRRMKEMSSMATISASLKGWRNP